MRNEYIIRYLSGKEKCIIADNLTLDMITFKAILRIEYHYMEEKQEGVYNYVSKMEELEVPLNDIKLIGVIKYDEIASGDLYIIYKKGDKNEK